MNEIKQERLSNIIAKDVSEIIQFDVKEDVGFVTVTGARVTNDYSYATIYVSIMGSEQDKKNSLHALEKAKGFIRSELAQRLDIRRCPELIFKEDTSIDTGNRIDAILQKLEEDKK